MLLPPYDTAVTLAALAAVISRYRAAACRFRWATAFMMMDGRGASEPRLPRRLARPAARARLGLGRGKSRSARARRPAGRPCASLQRRRRRRPSRASPGSALARRARSRAICTRSAHIAARAGGVRRRCFATDTRRCVLPAFGAYAGGLSICATRPSPICSIPRASRPSSSAKRASMSSTPRPSAAPGGHNVGHDGLKGSP